MTMSQELLTLVRRFRGGEWEVLCDPLDLMHDGVRMSDVIDSRGTNPQWNPPGQGG